MKLKIDRIYAWISTDKAGNEGILGTAITIAGRPMFAPLVGADKARMESCRPHAQEIHDRMGVPVKLCLFIGPMEIDTL